MYHSSLYNNNKKSKTMSKGKMRKRPPKNQLTLEDLEGMKSQNAMIGFLAKNKGVVLTVSVVFLLLFVDIILTFLMAFKLI